MNKYILITKNFGTIEFVSETDEDAEEYVEENYDSDDGPMKLFRATLTCEWG